MSVWIKVKGGARATRVHTESVTNVDKLLRVVHMQLVDRLRPNGITSDLLLLYEKEADKDDPTKVLEPDVPIMALRTDTSARNPLYVHYEIPNQPAASSTDSQEWCHVTGKLFGWANNFGALRGVFEQAVQHKARGIKDRCIVHSKNAKGTHDIKLDLWFEKAANYTRFEAALLKQEVFPQQSINLEKDMSVTPEEKPPLIELMDYMEHINRPEHAAPTASTSSMAGGTAAAALRAQLEMQRVDQAAARTYQNMHIIPEVLLEDGRKLTCKWLFLSGSAAFHSWFDGPDTAPHLNVTIDGEEPAAELTHFTLKVDTSKVDEGAVITKLGFALNLPAGERGFTTKVSLPTEQAAYFRKAIEWRARCVSAAWDRINKGEKLNTNGSGGRGWWTSTELPPSLKEAIAAAKGTL